MSRKIDLTGQRFGRLVVIRENGCTKDKKIAWECRCDCGVVKTISGGSLRTGNSTSCGCYTKEQTYKACFIDMTGKKYGRLTVISRGSNAKDGKAKWVVQCECGTVKEVLGKDLRNGKIVSCGCYQKEAIKNAIFKDLTGKTFGRLTVLSIDSNRSPSNHYKYICQCVCGNIVSVIGGDLSSGRTTSCGCYSREINTIHGLSYTKTYRNSISVKYRDKKLMLDITWIPEMEFALRENFTACAICGITEEKHMTAFGKSLSIDHVLPLSKGFGLKPGNAVVLCSSCNSKKNNKMLNELPLEWQADLIWAAFKFKDCWEKRIIV